MLNKLSPPEWLSCVIVLAFGYCTGMQLGKVAPFVDRVGAELGLGLTYVGWLTSLLALFVAFAAIPASRLIVRLGALAGLKAGALVMLAGAILFGTVSGAGALLAARAVEAAGYVFAVIAAPAYLAAAAPARLRAAFLALWASVVPVGFALANLLASGQPQDLGLSAAFLQFALPLAALAPLLLIITDRRVRPEASPGSRMVPAGSVAWVLVLGFGCYVYLSIGFFACLPAFAVAHPEQQVSPASVALFVPTGTLTAALVLARLRGRQVLGLAITGLLGIAAAALLVFSGEWRGGLAMPVYAFACGISASSIFAAVPMFAPGTSSSARTLGAIAQAGGTVVLVAPPIAGAVIERLGWSALAASFITVALIETAAILLTMRTSKAVSRDQDVTPTVR